MQSSMNINLKDRDMLESAAKKTFAAHMSYLFAQDGVDPIARTLEAHQHLSILSATLRFPRAQG